MAKASAAPVAPSDEETFEVNLTEGETPLTVVEETETEPEVETEQPAPVAKAKPKPVEVEAEPEAEKPHESLSPAAREERRKRKQYAQKWQDATEERDVALAELERLRRRPGTTKEQRESLLKRAEEADSMRSLMEMAVDEMDRRDQLYRDEIFGMKYQHKCDIAEVQARARHADYDDVMQRSGIYEAVQIDPSTGTWKNPELGKRIYLTRDGQLRADPAEAAYQLAVGKIESEATKNGDEPDAEPARASAEPKQPVKTATKPEVKTIDEARREGAREVVERVAANASRPKGISSLPNAGAPTSARLTRRQLDEIQDKDPARYLRMVTKDPTLKRWHLGGY